MGMAIGLRQYTFPFKLVHKVHYIKAMGCIRAALFEH